MNQRGTSALQAVFQALQDFGGYFTFQDEQGQEYVLLRKVDFIDTAEGGRGTATEIASDDLQLTLTTLGTVVEPDNFEDVNRTIAMLTVEEADDKGLSEAAAMSEPPRRVRFEPIKGDLPPELQE